MPAVLARLLRAPAAAPTRTLGGASALVALLATTPAMLASQDVRPADLGGRSTVYAPHGMVATSQPLATSAALRVLLEGGNAFDAAVVAAAVLNVTEPHMTGVGGDMFALFWAADEERLRGLNASGRGGSLLDADMLLQEGLERMPGTGPRSVTVPGALSGWTALLERYGTLNLADALQPAIALAEEGFPVTPIIAEQWRDQVEKLARDPGATRTYLIDGTRGPEAGEWVRNPDLASSFRTIAREGPEALYGGSLGRTIVDGLADQGGYLTVEDMANHEATWVEPLSIDFRGYTVWELPPSGQGIAALQMLGMLAPLDLESMGHNSAEYLHHLIEAKKLAYEDLAKYVADPEWMTTAPEALLDPAYLAEKRAAIRPNAAAELPDPIEAVQASETIYLTVADRHGNMVSFINSIYGYFGSGIVIPGTGIMLQNRGGGFTLEEGHPNRAAAGKRPFHTIIPGFVTLEGRPFMSFGLMGGAMQPQGHAQLLINMLVFDMDPQEAIDAARFRHLSGRRVALEVPVGYAVRDRLEILGHEVIDGSVAYGGAQVVVKLERGWAGASDPRKDGHAAGH
jgi:gamma-glutamyltranspeptidase/glutathione hydrolase